MDIDKRNRTELKQYFKANGKPTEEQFSDLVDAGINQAEDGIAKVQGNPLAIEAQGEVTGTQEVLDLYRNFDEDTPDWSVNLNPRVDPQEPQSNQSGLNIKDAIGQSRLFIKSGDGNVGVGTIEPESKLTIKGNNSASLLSVIDATQEHTKILEVTKKEGVSIKGSLKIDGDVTMKNLKAENISASADLDNDNASNDKIPTQKAVKTYVKTHVKAYVDNRLPKGLISMWSGEDVPEGWALCNGANNTPNLSGKFIVGYNNNNVEYNEIGKTGGLEQLTLTTDQIPSHHHTGNTGSAGNHNHSFTGAKAKGDGTGTGSSNDYYGATSRTTASAGNHTHFFNTDKTGGSEPHENRPPYFVLAYIMKL